MSFHVGSQQRDLGAWDDTLEIVAGIFLRAGELGAAPAFLNLGGGFPTKYLKAVPGTNAYANAIHDGLAKHFGKMDGIMMESGFSVSVSSEVMAILAVSSSLKDMRERMGRIIVAVTSRSFKRRRNIRCSLLL